MSARSKKVYWSPMRGGVVEGEVLVMGNKNLATVLNDQGRWNVAVVNRDLGIPEFTASGESALTTKDAAKALAFRHVKQALAKGVIPNAKVD